MDKIIEKHFGQGIKERRQLLGGYSFQTWKLTLDSGQDIVFRTGENFTTGGGRHIIINETFEREKFFYDTLNQKENGLCPKVLVIDGNVQITEYLPGKPLAECFASLDKKEKEAVYRRFGEITASIGRLQIDPSHKYIKERGPWKDFFAARLRERLMAIIKNNIVTEAETEKIIAGWCKQEPKNTLSFIHLDLRFANMLYDKGKIHLLDAENSEFGDHLFEFSVLAMNNYLCDAFWEGYGSKPDLGQETFRFYRMERAALVVDVFLNEVHDETEAQQYINLFNSLKG